MEQVRECLKLDPDHKECFPHYKKVKEVAKLVANMQSAANENNYEACASAAKKVRPIYATRYPTRTRRSSSTLQVLTVDPVVVELVFQANDKLCHCLLHAGEHAASVEHCTAALAIHQEPRLLCDRAEDYIALDMYDQAQQDYAKVAPFPSTVPLRRLHQL